MTLFWLCLIIITAWFTREWILAQRIQKLEEQHDKDRARWYNDRLRWTTIIQAVSSTGSQWVVKLRKGKVIEEVRVNAKTEGEALSMACKGRKFDRVESVTRT